ncbi:MAG TPA: hypothetical protein VGG71_16700 [Chitinophagaceae bacterium]
MDIAVVFEHKGQYYKGTLSEVSGTANKSYHLTIGNYFWGQLSFVQVIDYPGRPIQPGTAKYKWKFISQEDGEIEELSRRLGSMVDEVRPR